MEEAWIVGITVLVVGLFGIYWIVSVYQASN